MGCKDAYDDSATLSVVWDAINDAVRPKKQRHGQEQQRRQEEEAELKKEEGEGGGGKGVLLQVDNVISPAASSSSPSSVVPSPPLGTRRRMGGVGGTISSDYAGSCSCPCGGNGFGKCFNIPKDNPPAKPGDCSSVPGWNATNTSSPWQE